MLHFRDSGQEIENEGFDKEFKKELLWFLKHGTIAISGVPVRR